MKYLITGRAKIERGVFVDVPYVVISIRDPGTRHADIKGNPLDVLYTAFDDAQRVDGLPVHPDVLLMTDKQAQVIWRFFYRYQREVEVIVCHCEAGKHRSPAVAAALCKGSGGDDEMFFSRFQLNHFVYQQMLNARPSTPLGQR